MAQPCKGFLDISNYIKNIMPLVIYFASGFFINRILTLLCYPYFIEAMMPRQNKGTEYE